MTAPFKKLVSCEEYFISVTRKNILMTGRILFGKHGMDTYFIRRTGGTLCVLNLAAGVDLKRASNRPQMPADACTHSQSIDSRISTTII